MQAGLFDRRTRADEIEAEFRAFDRAHPEVWEAFVRFARELAAAGCRRVGVALIVERIRWETAVRGGEDFKINNDFRAHYARKWARLYPQHADLFETRRLRSEDEPARGGYVDRVL